MPDRGTNTINDDLAVALTAAQARWDHAEAPYDPDILSLIRAAEAARDRLAAIVDKARSLNRPMVHRLRSCAADTSPNWEGETTVYPPETRNLVRLLDLITEGTDPDA